MSIFGSDYDHRDDLFILSGDLDTYGNKITDLKHPADSNDAVNKIYMNSHRIQIKGLENP